MFKGLVAASMAAFTISSGSGVLASGPALSVARGSAPASIQASVPVTGSYVEARNANVFVGACHFGSEYQELGRDAILAWHVGSGEENGVKLSGLNVVAVVAAENNLSDVLAGRESVVYTDARADAAQTGALKRLAEQLAGKSLGTVVATHSAPIKFTVAGDRFTVAVRGMAQIDASRLADRACCIMPYQVWYRPLAKVDQPIVGSALANQYSGKDLHTSWSYPGQNSAFIGSFRLGS